MSYSQALREVLTELGQFVLGAILQSPVRPSTVSLPSLPPPLTPPIETREGVVAAPLSTHTIAYCCQTDVPVYERPVRALDTVILTLAYAQSVVVERHEGQFTQVVVDERRGWVHKDTLVYDETVIFPQLSAGVYYDAHHPTTVAIRRYLHDHFAAVELVLPLLPSEYVMYWLARRNRSISWPAVRPRPVGRWHELLRGVRGIHSGIEPRTGSLMEWVSEKGIGELRVVVAVHPDLSLVVSGVSTETDIFLEETIIEPVWRSVRPVFITVS